MHEAVSNNRHVCGMETEAAAPDLGVVVNLCRPGNRGPRDRRRWLCFFGSRGLRRPAAVASIRSPSHLRRAQRHPTLALICPTQSHSRCSRTCARLRPAARSPCRRCLSDWSLSEKLLASASASTGPTQQHRSASLADRRCLAANTQPGVPRAPKVPTSSALALTATTGGSLSRVANLPNALFKALSNHFLASQTEPPHSPQVQKPASKPVGLSFGRAASGCRGTCSLCTTTS